MDDASTFHVPEPKVLSVVRAAIDRVDDGLVLLLAGRRRLAGLASRIKRRVGLPAMDAAREADVRRRGRAWAAHLGVPEPLVDQVLELAIADAVRAQASSGGNSAREAALSLLPPPRRAHEEVQRLTICLVAGLVLILAGRQSGYAKGISQRVRGVSRQAWVV